MKILYILFLPFLLSACQPDPSLKGHTYILQNTDLAITLSFDTHENKYSGKAVNKYFGTYTVNKNKIRFSAPQSSMYSGNEDDLMTEDTYLNDLPKTVFYTLTKDSLNLTLSDGRHLAFSRQD